MLGHLGVNVSNLGRAQAYYDQLMPLLGFEPYLRATDQFAYRRQEGKPGTYLFFYPALEAGEYSCHRTGLQHLAFIVPSRVLVASLKASSILQSLDRMAWFLTARWKYNCLTKKLIYRVLKKRT